MTTPSPNLSPLQLGKRITLLPVVHGSGQAAWAIQRWLLENPCDCLAVTLPDSFREPVLAAVNRLPIPSIVIQPSLKSLRTDWQPAPSEQDMDDDDEDDDDDLFGDEDYEPAPPWSYVPVDPCQAVIASIRFALGEHKHIEFIDLETDQFIPHSSTMPDPYALRTVPIEKYAAAVLPSLERPEGEQIARRLEFMGWRLRQLEKNYENIVMVCGLQLWPWLREAYHQPLESLPEHDEVRAPQIYNVDPSTQVFLMGELPFITGLYEKSRAELEDDSDLAIDGVKHLLLAARNSYIKEFGSRARRITPLLLSQTLKYIRNLSLIERRMTPDLYTIVLACQQILGDQYTIHVVETAKEYPFQANPPDENMVQMGVEQARLPDDEMVDIVSRLPGSPLEWRSLELQRRPERVEQEKWSMQWNPFGQCSWPPEDERIESFRARVFERAQAILGMDLASSEKFSTSIKDGIDIRETLRHWYDQDIYVKVIPPTIGNLDCCVMLFDSPADPRDYPWRTTWFAEHENESTLAFFATDFRQEMVGPGIALANYGGAMFLYPPVQIDDIWTDPRLDFCDSLEDRLIAAACLYSRARQVALLSPLPPGAGWRRLARHFHKTLIHVPLTHFNDAMIQQLRMVHVLNGQEVRSFASHFIRRA